MQVTQINILPHISFKGINGNNQYDYSRNKLFIAPRHDVFHKTDCKFITTQGEFRELPQKRLIHCPYCGKPMIAVKTLYDMKNRGVFSGPIREFVKEVKPYEECLKPGNREVFKTIELYAMKAPNTHLSRVLRLMYRDSLKRLREAQKPIFMEFARAANDLPDEYKPEFRKFMEKQRYRLLEIPYIEEFNADDFHYKTKKLSETIPNDRIKNSMIQLADALNHPSFSDPTIEIPDKIINKIFPADISNNKLRYFISQLGSKKTVKLDDDNIVMNIICANRHNGNNALRRAFIHNLSEAMNNPDFDCESVGINKSTAEKLKQIHPDDKLAAQNLIKKDIQLYVINEIRRFGEKLDRDDIKSLCDTYENMVAGRPVVIPFSNKAFMRDLVLQLKGLEQTDIYYRLTDIAKKLPNSESNKNSFITKHKLSNSDTIGYYLLRPSIATIEHIIPTAQNGKNIMGNWALACEFDNNKRLDMIDEDYKNYMKKFDPQNPQRYFEDIMDAAFDGEINPKDILKQAESFKTAGNIIIDTSRIQKLLNKSDYRKPFC